MSNKRFQNNYYFTYHFKALVQRPQFKVVLLTKEQGCFKRCKNNGDLSTILRRCSDVMITAWLYQQHGNVFLTS